MIKRLKLGGCTAFGGLSAVHSAQIVAAIRRLDGRRIIMICSDEMETKKFAADIEAFSGESVRIIPGREFTFHHVDTASREWEIQRLKALDSLCTENGIYAASIEALLQRTMPPEVLVENSFELRTGEVYEISDLAKRLSCAGYERTTRVEGCGQFAIRGEILDVFTPSYDEPIRIDFFGDEIDSIGYFDPATQRKTVAAEFVRIIPAAESVPAAGEGGIGTAYSGMIAAAKSSMRSKTGKKAAETIMHDAERLKNEGYFSAADRYMPIIFPMACALDYFDDDTVCCVCETGRIHEKVKNYEWRLSEDIKSLMEDGVLGSHQTEFSAGWESYLHFAETHSTVMLETFISSQIEPKPKEILTINAKQLPSYGGSLETAMSDIRHYNSMGYHTYVLTASPFRSESLQKMLSDAEIPATRRDVLSELPTDAGVVITVGNISGGFEYPSIKTAVITEGQIMYRRKRSAVKRSAKSNRVRIQSYADLHPGDLIVHDQHGVGRFVGIEKIKVDNIERDYIKIEYLGTDILYVPATQLDMVSKYIGASGEDSPVHLNRLSGTDWQKTKTKAKSAARDMAKKLIALYAARARLPGYAFPEDDEWQRQFEESFEFEETDDQLKCAEEIKRDMEKPHPMDRLLCGDVGYGKTEVALRAAMKCVLAGRQAAILVPTTVLARQHYMTVLRRFADYPVKVELLSRFQNTAETKRIMSRLEDGRIDIVVGTHKLLNKNIKFAKLGLLIIDEEQRFGVTQKEKLREITQGVDTLTMTATPIPRTLNMALSGVRDMSTIEEAPHNRQPVQTYVLENDMSIIRDAISREIARGGQVYYLHNRVETIDSTAAKLKRMLPDVIFDVGHGKMNETQLNEVMRRMTSGETQVLVCTTIIESGIDIPNVNTLIVEDADKLGLAQLHQIRGRVGRSNRRAYAYLTYRPGHVLSEVSTKRLAAMREYAGFGAGFHIAMRDLEIRGAGNILGAEQSGHMMSVGYDMYLRLLEEAVLEEKGEAPAPRCETTADLKVTAAIPDKYMSDAGERMDIYRRIALIKEQEDAEDMIDELIDRFGEPPKAVMNLISIALLRSAASRAGINEVNQNGRTLMFFMKTPNVERISAVISLPDYKARLLLNAGDKPYISYKLKDGQDPIDAAKKFILAYAGE